MSVTLDDAKAQLRIRHAEQDAFITLLMNAAQATLERYTGDNWNPDADDLRAAQLVLLEHLFYPDQGLDMDEVTGLPLTVAALARPYRKPTLV